MDKFYHSVRLDADLCKGCINCIKRCPTEAIRVRGGKAQINSKFCIDCGECIRVCPHKAKKAIFDKLEDIGPRYKWRIALPPPSLSAKQPTSSGEADSTAFTAGRPSYCGVNSR